MFPAFVSVLFLSAFFACAIVCGHAFSVLFLFAVVAVTLIVGHWSCLVSRCSKTVSSGKSKKATGQGLRNPNNSQNIMLRNLRQIFPNELRVLVTQIHTHLNQLSFSVEHGITFELALAPS